jgi:hypothetical protein
MEATIPMVVTLEVITAMVATTPITTTTMGATAVVTMEVTLVVTQLEAAEEQACAAPQRTARVLNALLDMADAQLPLVPALVPVPAPLPLPSMPPRHAPVLAANATEPAALWADLAHRAQSPTRLTLTQSCAVTQATVCAWAPAANALVITAAVLGLIAHVPPPVEPAQALSAHVRVLTVLATHQTLNVQ